MHQIDKLNLLLTGQNKLFHTADLSVLWQISNKNTLYSNIRRYIARGVLIPVQKGMYSVAPLDKIDPVKLGVSFLHGFCYLSCETILARAGIINQAIYSFTFVSGSSKKFQINGYSYISRKLAEKFLHQTVGTDMINGILTASVERAVADMQYFNPKYYFDNQNLIDWEKVKQIQKEVGYK